MPCVLARQELFGNEGYGLPADIYSFGILLVRLDWLPYSVSWWPRMYLLGFSWPSSLCLGRLQECAALTLGQ